MNIRLRDVFTAAAALSILGFVALLWVRPGRGATEASVTAQVSHAGEELAEQTVRQWIKDSMADPQAELKELSVPFTWDDEVWRTAIIRMRNQMGGWSFHYYIVKLSPDKGAVHYEEQLEDYAQFMAKNHRHDEDNGLHKVFSFLNAAHAPDGMSARIKFGEEITK